MLYHILCWQVNPVCGTNSEKSEGVVWKNLPEGPPMGKFIRQSLWTFHCLSDFGLQKPKKMRPELPHGLVWKNSGFGLAQF